jgi:hypothetical protein
MVKKKILFICGSLNQTTMMHKIACHLADDYDCYFTPYYADGFLRVLLKAGLLDFSILGGQFRRRTEAYLVTNNLQLDYEGKAHDYDLVLTCSDLVMPKNILGKKVILVQEGMTDPEHIAYHLVKFFHLPLYLASTSTTGLSHAYDIFCVASEGYRELFIHKGVKPEKIIVTGIPNFDNCQRFLNNDFPHKHYVLVCSSDSRETFKYENRKAFIRHALDIANGRQVIFKLHPNENVKRAIREINKYAPNALVYPTGNTEHMIANCDVLVTRFSTVVYVGIALGKQVYSEFDLNTLYRQAPIQNGGTSATSIARVCRQHVEGHPFEPQRVTSAVRKVRQRRRFAEAVLNLFANAKV